MRRSLKLTADWLAVIMAGLAVFAVSLGVLSRVPW
jgi:hypothetical protein